jgi:hypothetical protein
LGHQFALKVHEAEKVEKICLIARTVLSILVVAHTTSLLLS